MSADNWTVCPRCVTAENERILGLKDQSRNSYGKVSIEKFLESDRAAEQLPRYEETLREDFDIGISEEGEFSVSYSAQCERCGLKYRFKHREEVKR